MRAAHRPLAVFAIAFVAWASVADNPAVCPDEQGETSHGHGTPEGPHCCLSAPCHTPTVAPAVAAVSLPASTVAAAERPAVAVLTSIDSPAPPTPPPTVLD